MADKPTLFPPTEEQPTDSTEGGQQSDSLFNQKLGSAATHQGKSTTDLGALESNGTVPKATPEADHISKFTGKGGAGIKPGVAGLVEGIKDLRNAKDKGPAAVAVALLVIVISVVGIISGTSLLGQSINGNLISRFSSGMSMFEQANNALVGPRLFGNGTCSSKKLLCEMNGVTPEQLDQMKQNGVKFTPEDGHQLDDGSGRVTFDSMEIEGETITADNMKEKLKNPKIKKALLPITKPTSWVAEKNYQRARVKKYLGINENPDTDAKDKKTFERKAYENTHAEATEVTTGQRVAGDVEEDTSDPDSGSRVTDTDISAGSESITAEVARLERAALAGELTDTNLPIGDVQEAIGREGGISAEGDNLLKQGWAWLNSVDVIDTACTAYQIGNTAAAIARTISLVNAIRYGYMFLATWDKVKAGEASQGDITQLMNTVTSLNKYGESFDSSVGMQYAFTGKISTSTPATFSTTGGQTLQEMATAFTQFNRFFDVAGAATGAPQSALRGYQVVKGACALATNLAFQISATIIDWGVTLITTPFTGGATLASNIGGKAAIKTAFKAGKELLIKNFKKDIVNLVSRNATKVERQVARKNALLALRRQATDPIQATMIGLTLVETFGMDYIARSLAGTDIYSYLNDSVQTGDVIVGARAGEDAISTIAAGGVIQKLPQADASTKVNDKAIQDDIAFQKEIADPLDVNNQYSTVGSFLMSFAGQLGGINTSSFLSSARDVLNIPSSSFSKLSTSASALGEEATAQNLSDFVNDPVLKELNIANDIMGNPKVAGNVEYLKTVDPKKLLGSAIDQGYIRPDGTPIKGSAYGKHVDECNNPARTQVDETLFPAETIQPASCRDGSDLNNFFNAVTTFLSLLVNPADKPESDGTKAEIAQRIIDKGNVTFWSGNAGVHPTLQEIADGSNNGNDLPCGINIYILKIIDTVSDKYPVTVNDLNRYCEKDNGVPFPGSPPNAKNFSSPHYRGNGSAIDFGFVNGKKLNGRDPMSQEVIEMITPILAEAFDASGGKTSGIGQSNCGPIKNKPPNVRVFEDGCNHLHVDVAPESDPELQLTTLGK